MLEIVRPWADAVWTVGIEFGTQIGKGNLPDGRSDSDMDYLRDSLAYADQLSPGGALAAQLVVSDGTRIPSHIAHFYMQSWGMNPMRNIWFADQLQCHLRDTC